MPEPVGPHDHRDSWNEYHESTIIEPTTAFGTQYLELTKHEGDLFCAGELGSLIQ